LLRHKITSGGASTSSDNSESLALAHGFAPSPREQLAPLFDSPRLDRGVHLSAIFNARRVDPTVKPWGVANGRVAGMGRRTGPPPNIFLAEGGWCGFIARRYSSKTAPLDGRSSAMGQPEFTN